TPGTWSTPPGSWPAPPGVWAWRSRGSGRRRPRAVERTVGGRGPGPPSHFAPAISDGQENRTPDRRRGRRPARPRGRPEADGRRGPTGPRPGRDRGRPGHPGRQEEAARRPPPPRQEAPQPSEEPGTEAGQRGAGPAQTGRPALEGDEAG